MRIKWCASNDCPFVNHVWNRLTNCGYLPARKTKDATVTRLLTRPRLTIDDFFRHCYQSYAAQDAR
jgi:hypothetical protein